MSCVLLPVLIYGIYGSIMENKEKKTRLLQAIAEEVKACTKCQLCRYRKNTVPGEGNVETDVMFIGEGPGYWEDVKGRPFVGQAGKLLDSLLKSIGISREKVYITNIVKCRPPGNRDPQGEEIDQCRRYLIKQIEIIEPKVICTLGRFAFRVISERSRSISFQHGIPFKKENFTVFPLYHPAAALHQSPLLGVLKDDFIKLSTLLASLTEEEKEEKKSKQMELFS